MGKQENEAPSSNAPKPKPAEQEELDKALLEFLAKSVPLSEYADDIRLMLEHCRNRGIVVSKAVQEFLPPLKDVSPSDTSHESGTTRRLEKVLKLHEQLAALIVPATPHSLAATEFSLKRLRHNRRPLMTWVLFGFFIAMAGLGLRCYIRVSWELAAYSAEREQAVNAGQDPNSPEENAAPDTDANDAKSEFSQTNDASEPESETEQGTLGVATLAKLTQQSYLCAALLGAAFSALFTMQHYIRNRSFETNYAYVYLVRFTVGVVAGVILANFGRGLFDGVGTISKLGPSGIALLGGYSAEAVRQILDRLVQVLVATVKGREPAAEKFAVAQELLSIAEKKGDEGGKPKPIETVVADLIKNPGK